MGDSNQANFVKAHAELIKAPILEVGSKDYGKTPDFKAMFSGYEYTGIDREEGKGVDLVLDLTSDSDFVDKQLQGKKFNTIICFSVLEHCKEPFKMTNNITRLQNTDGLLFVSVPFSWRIHDFPADYWRFTPDGVKALFPVLDFDKYPGIISTCKQEEIAPIDKYLYRTELSVSEGLRLKRYGYLRAGFVVLCRKLKIFPSLFDYPYAFPPVLITMIGKK